MDRRLELSTTPVTLIKKCHVCGTVQESKKEMQKCKCCSQSFMPTNYFGKVHAKNSKEFENLFCDAEELYEDDLILGLNVLW